MGITGWLGNDEPDPEPQAPGGFTGFILANRPDPAAGRTLEQALARAAQAPGRADPEPEDFDGRAAGMLTRGYSPGLISQLAMRLQDVFTELAGEQEKLQQGARRSERVQRMHATGQIRAWDIPGMLGDLGDEGRVQQLERQAQQLRQQLEAAHEAAAPPRPQQLDGVEAASRHAQQLLAEVTREQAAAATGAPRARRPKGHGYAVRSETPCPRCDMSHEKLDITDAECFLVCNDPHPAPVPAVPSEAELDMFGYLDQTRAERRRGGYREISRVTEMAVR